MTRKLFSTFTVLLVVLCAWTAYANVFSDDTAVRALARSTVDKAAGCGDDCKLEGLRGDRGMFEERIEYDIVKRGRFVVVCRRAFIVAGDHGCDVTDRPAATTPTASARQ